jgi:predicted dienelactone hydrolase
MRTLRRIGISLALTMTVLMIAAGASFLLSADRPEHPVGFQIVAVPNPPSKPLQVAVWYPTGSRPGFHFVQFAPQIVAANGTVAGRGLPLILISHGGGEPLAGRAEGALALASAGFVAAAVVHPDDETVDRRYIAMPRWLIDRPREIHLTLEYMLTDWPAHGQLDASRVGMFGYSNGGLTALISLGGVPNPARIASHWPQAAGPLPTAPAAAWRHDPTIKAAVLAAPAGVYLFEPDGLAQVTAPVQIWNGTIDRVAPFEKNAALLQRLLPKPPELHLIPGAGHFSFLPSCPLVLRWAPFCREMGRFDRAAFHREFNRSVIEFYRRNLRIAGGDGDAAPTEGEALSKPQRGDG